MKAAERERFREWIRNLVTKLKSYFYLDGWNIDIFWDKDMDGTPDAGPGVCPVYMVSNDAYLHAALTYTPYAEELWEEGHKDKLIHTTVHEFSHILTRPMFDYAEKLASKPELPFLLVMNERAAEMVANVIQRGIPDDFIS